MWSLVGPKMVVPLSFFLSFSSVSVIFGLIGHKKPAFWPFTNQLAVNFARFVFKDPDRYVYLIQ